MKTGDIDSVNHVGIAVRNMEDGCALYEALGFTLSPLSVHSGSKTPGAPVEPMATGNRCAIFPNNYIEVLGIVNPGALDWSWGDFINRFQGAHIICFGCKDAEVVNTRVSGNGIETSGVITLQRDIGTPEGVRTAIFDCVHFERAGTPEGLIQAARHRFPEYVHQDRYLTHRNGVISLGEVILVTEDPEAVARHYEKLTGETARKHSDRLTIDLAIVTRLVFMKPEAIAAAFPGTLFSPVPSITALGFTVKNLAQTEAVLKDGGFNATKVGEKIVVPAEEALGAVHYFYEA